MNLLIHLKKKKIHEIIAALRTQLVLLHENQFKFEYFWIRFNKASNFTLKKLKPSVQENFQRKQRKNKIKIMNFGIIDKS